MFIPFNHQPDSVSVKTGSYTIPAGKYARVQVLEGNADFTIGGSIAIEQWEFSGSATLGAGVKFTNDSPYVLIGSIITNNSATGTLAAFNKNATLPTTQRISDYTTGALAEAVPGDSVGKHVRLLPGDFLQPVTANAVTTGYWNFVAENIPSKLEFWVPSGTALVGDKYIVEEYNELT